jgi:ubiquinone/menaquinone biosynthesis C-methylase UbiE
MRPESELKHLPQDYRQSHVGKKGVEYDETLRDRPFDSYMAKWEAWWLERLVMRMYPNGVNRYLDFACGSGRITEIVAAHARESVGVDVSSSMLEAARRKCPQTQFMCADLTSGKVDIGLFELITSFRFFGNAQDALRVAALQTIVALLPPGGSLVINNHRNPYAIATLLHRATGGSLETDLHYFKLRRLLHSCGLRIVAAHAIGFRLVRSSMLENPSIMDAADRWETSFSAAPFAAFAPDCILVAQKPA